MLGALRRQAACQVRRNSVKIRANWRVISALQLSRNFYYLRAESEPKKDYEIDPITLRRRYFTPPPDKVVRLFPTHLDPESPLSGTYDADVVENALIAVWGYSCNEDPYPVYDFVEDHLSELSAFTQFLQVSYGDPTMGIDKLTAPELQSALKAFHTLYNHEVLPNYDGDGVAALDSMVNIFLKISSDPDQVSRVGLLLQRLPEKSSYVTMYSAGIGNFIPELRVLSHEFNFEELNSIAPVVEKISILVAEFSRFLDEHGATHDYDADFFKVLIYVLRYKRLREILLAVSKEDILPHNLLAVSRNSDSKEVQEIIEELSQEIKDLLSITHENLDALNLVLSSTGLDSFDVVFAELYAESERLIYSEKEKHLMEKFVEDFLPLTCNGILSIDSLPPIYDMGFGQMHNSFVRFRVSDDIIKNFEFSLAVLYGVPSIFHIIKLATKNIGKSLDNITPEEMEEALMHFDGNYCVLDEELEVFDDFSSNMLDNLIRGSLILDTFSKDPVYLELAQMASDTLISDTEDVIDLLPRYIELKRRSEISITPVRIEGLELNDFKGELKKFNSVELMGCPFSQVTYVSLLREMNALIERNDCEENQECNITPSSINDDNVDRFSTLYELLCANFDINGGSTVFLDTIIEGVADLVPETNDIIAPTEPVYFQIPEELGLHDFHRELQIFKVDELRSSYKNFTSAAILELLDKRVNQFAKELPNSNVASRMNQENLPRFMKLSAKLKALFALNGGHTEILDAVLNSQATLVQFEEKLAEKREKLAAAALTTPNSKDSDLYSNGPYVDIPDNFYLHEFVNELKIFKQDELRSSFKNFSAEKVLTLMSKRIKEIYRGLPNSNLALRMGKDNIVSFIKLHAKLQKLLVWNGGNTGILDALIYSQEAFEDFEAALESKKAENKPEDRSTEIEQTSSDLGTENYAFESCDHEHDSLEDLPYIANLRYQFEDDQDVDFDAQITANEVDIDAVDNRFIMSEFLDADPHAEVVAPIDYHDPEYVLSLLNNETPVNFSDEHFADEAAIKDAVTRAMSKEENKIFEEDPEEYAAINNLTAQKIRESYKVKALEPHLKATEKEYVDKASLQDFLVKAKHEKEVKEESKFRAQKAYEWSQGMAKSHRSLESRNFFNPICALSKYSEGVSMFPSIRKQGAVEYLVLTLNGQTFVSSDNPLGPKHVPEDMFTILERFPEEELERLSKSFRKLQKKNWKLIGGGGNERMLVLSRVQSTRKRSLWKRLKTVLATTGVVFISMLGLNVWLDDVQVPLAIPEPQPALPASEKIVPVEQMPAAEPRKEASLWKRLLWSS